MSTNPKIGEAVELVRGGMTRKAAAKELGLGVRLVTKACKQAGLVLKGHAAVKLVRDGMTYFEAADAVGVGVVAVRTACRKAGVRALRNEQIQPRKIRQPNLKTRQAIELVRGGMTRTEAANELGILPSVVSRACKRSGLPAPKGRKKAADFNLLEENP